jgi:type 1 glutamine amidotransferase
MTLRLQVVTGGHPFEAREFFAVFDRLAESEDLTWTATTAPTIPELDPPDVVLFYDMPGLRFSGGGDRAHEPPVTFPEPTPEQRGVFDELQHRGIGMVFLHHAVASWPAWAGFAELVGGRFHYQPATLRGIDYPDSGYVFDVAHTVEVIDPTHPICEGLDASFELTDELYCFPVFAQDVIPIMRTRFPVNDPSRFFSADKAIRGQMNSNEGWTHPAGSDLVAWVKNVGNSRLAYLQFGDGPVTYGDPNFRRIVRNTILWAASP